MGTSAHNKEHEELELGSNIVKGFCLNIQKYSVLRLSLSALFTTFAVNNTFTTPYTKDSSLKIWKELLF